MFSKLTLSLAMGCICMKRQGYKKLGGDNQLQADKPSDLTVTAPTIQDSPSKPIQESTGQVRSPSIISREVWAFSPPPPVRPIQEATIHAPSRAFVSNHEVCVISRREDCGYAFRIPEGSVDKVNNITVTLHLPESETYSVPKGSEFVSGVCHIVSKETELESGSLVIDHCINARSAEDRDSLCVVKHNERRENAASSENDHFQYVDNSDVDVRSDSVVVMLRKLESAYYAVVCANERRAAVGFCGMLYRETNLTSPSKFIFMVVKDLPFCIQVCTSFSQFLYDILKPLHHVFFE